MKNKICTLRIYRNSIYVRKNVDGLLVDSIEVLMGGLVRELLSKYFPGFEGIKVSPCIISSYSIAEVFIRLPDGISIDVNSLSKEYRIVG